MAELDNCFRVLGLRTDASWGQVADAWRNLSKQHHPDTKLVGSEEQTRAEEYQKQLNMAYERLKSHYNEGSVKDVIQANYKNADDFFSSNFNVHMSDSFGQKSACSPDHMEAEFLRACQLANASAPNYDLLKAVSILKSIATLGHARAQFRLGHIYFDGIMKDLTQAAYWWQRSAESGYINAQFNLALLYERGLGITKDQSKAMLWFERAARCGDAEAASIVGSRGKSFLKKPNYWFRGI